jgi:hypothetical protein
MDPLTAWHVDSTYLDLRLARQATPEWTTGAVLPHALDAVTRRRSKRWRARLHWAVLRSTRRRGSRPVERDSDVALAGIGVAPSKDHPVGVT